MNPNIGRVNAYVRITAGLTTLAWSTAKLSQRSANGAHVVGAMMGAMKVAEGMTRFCPMVYMLELNRSKAKEEYHEV